MLRSRGRAAAARAAGCGASEDPGARWRRTLAALLRDRKAPRLRSLILAHWTEHAPDPCDIDFESGAAGPLLRRHGGRLVALERLFIRPFPVRSDDGYCMGVGPALANLPALQRLEMCGQRGWDLLPPAGHARLGALLVNVEEHDDDVLAVLLTAPFPALTVLEPRCCPEVMEALRDGPFVAALASGQFPRLKRLTLSGLGEDEAAEAEAALGARGIAVVIRD